MALPLTEPDPLAWRVALRLAKRDARRLKVSDDGLTVWVLNNPQIDHAAEQLADLRPGPADLARALARPQVVLELEKIRAAGGTHLAVRGADYAFCTAPLVGPWTVGQDVTCPACTSSLATEA